MNESRKPVIKWVGGKRQLLPEITPRFPQTFQRYCEPFLGGGAVFFSLQPEKYLVSDVNPELINLYTVIRDNVDELIHHLSTMQVSAEEYYRIRSLDRDESTWEKTTHTQRAARTIYLNRVGYNGLYRVNRAGQFNVPYGRHNNPRILNEETLRALCEYLNDAEGQILCASYEEAVPHLTAGDFVYFDPPYDPVSPSANFTHYTRDGFTRENQIALRDTCRDLHERGVKFMLSNSSTPFIHELYAEFHVEKVHARRSVNSNASRRGTIHEVLVRNYE